MRTMQPTSPKHQIKKDFDMDIAGWGPDFQDPSTYLDIFNPVDGSALAGMGINPSTDQSLIEKLGLNEYKQLLDDANAEQLDTKLVMKIMLLLKLG